MAEEELKIVIPAVVDDSADAKENFKASLSKLASNLKGDNALKVEVTVSKINAKSAINTFKKEIEDAIGKFGTESGGASIVNKNDFQKLKELKNLQNSLNKQFARTDNSDLLKRSEITSQIINATKEYDALIQKANLSQKQQNALLELSEKGARELSVIQAGKNDKTLKDTQKTLKNLSNIKSFGQINKDLSNAQTDIEKFKTFGKNVSDVENKFKKAEEAANEFKNALNSNNIEKITSEYEQYEKAIKSVKNSISSLSKDKSAETTFNKEMTSLRNLVLEMQRFEKANDKLRTNSKFSSSFDKLFSGVSNAVNNKDISGVDNFIERWKTLQSEMNSAGVVGQRFTTNLKNQLEKLGVYFSASAVILSSLTQIKNMITNVAELDKQLVNIQMVTGGTREQTANLVDTYNNMAKSLGATTVQVTTSANEFLRQGKSLEETNKLVEASMVLSKVGMLDSAESTQYLTSAMKGYKVSVQDVMSIVDKVSKIDMASATSAGGLMEGMSRVANFANDVGYSMDKLLATLATIGEVTQRDMSTVGDSLKYGAYAA